LNTDMDNRLVVTQDEKIAGNDIKLGIPTKIPKGSAPTAKTPPKLTNTPPPARPTYPKGIAWEIDMSTPKPPKTYPKGIAWEIDMSPPKMEVVGTKMKLNPPPINLEVVGTKMKIHPAPPVKIVKPVKPTIKLEEIVKIKPQPVVPAKPATGQTRNFDSVEFNDVKKAMAAVNVNDKAGLVDLQKNPIRIELDNKGYLDANGQPRAPIIISKPSDMEKLHGQVIYTGARDKGLKLPKGVGEASKLYLNVKKDNGKYFVKYDSRAPSGPVVNNDIPAFKASPIGKPAYKPPVFGSNASGTIGKAGIVTAKNNITAKPAKTMPKRTAKVAPLAENGVSTPATQSPTKPGSPKRTAKVTPMPDNSATSSSDQANVTTNAPLLTQVVSPSM
ncbi:hypothetical protein ACIPL2_09185, partial [Pseudomonas sp. NPDC086251]